MATSGVTTGLATARDIITRALELLGLQDPGATLDAALAKVALQHLNWMLKSLQGDGNDGWRQDTVQITWPGATAEQALATNYIDVSAARFVQSATFERPLARWEWAQFKDLPNKAQAGDPYVFCPIKKVGTIHIAVWPVPASSVTLNLDVARVIEDVTSLSQNLDIPQEWTETAYTGLADRLIPVMGTVMVDPNRAADVHQRAASLYSLFRDADRPGSYIFTR
jgi:hypothetical protein